MTLPAAKIALDFEGLYRTTRDDVFAYVATLLHDRGAAEDVTALAFERAFRKSAKFDSRRGSERAWLFGIARNAALDELRKRKRSAALAAEPEDAAPGPDEEMDRALRRAAVRTAQLDAEPEDTGPEPEEEADRALRRFAVRAALASLDARDRELIALKFHAGLDNAELAAVLGVSVSNAGTRLHRALTKLREILDDQS